MYYSLKGTLLLKESGWAVIECGGVAYEIKIGDQTLQELPEMGQEASLYTRLIVRENDLSLVGFSNPEDRRLYDTLVTVSGIGPKQALRILSEISGAELRNAIVGGDALTLSRIKGVGSKTAQRMILELKDRMSKLSLSEAKGVKQSKSQSKRLEVLMALRVLGYNDSESQKAIDTAFKANTNLFEQDTESILKEILSNMGKK